MSATSDAWPIWTPTSDPTPLDAVISHAALHGIYRIASVAERATLISALTAASIPTTVLYTHRLDATAGKEFEYTTDGGTTWRALDARDSGWITMSGFTNSFTAGTATPRYRLLGNDVILDGELFRTSAPGTSELTAFTLPVGYRPLSTVAFTTLTFGSLTQPTMVVIATDGSIKIASATGRTATPGYVLAGIRFPVA